MNVKNYQHLSLLLVIILSLGAVVPLFHAGFFPMHDDTQVARVFEMGKSLHDGMFPVRWVQDLGYGYGYPVFNFYAPLAYYVGGFLALFVDALFATKVMIVIGMVISGIAMYFLGKSFWGNYGGILSSVLYVYAPYHAVDLYVRGDIAELWAYAFFPVALLGVWMLYKKPSIKGIVIGSLGLTGIIISHNLSAFLFAPFLAVLSLLALLFSKEKKQTALSLAALFVFGFLLSAWYVLPVFGEMKYTNVLSQVGGGADFRDHFVCLSQLWQSPWGYGGSVRGCVDGLSFMIGKLQILFAFIGFIAMIFLFKKNKEKAIILAICLVAAFVSIFLLLPNSQFIWESISQMAFLQYPWRYLLLVSLFLSLVGGSIVWFLQKISEVTKIVVVVLLSFFVAGFSLKYFQPQKFFAVDSNYYTNKQQLIWTTSKISDEYLPRDFHKPTIVQEVPSTLVAIDNGTARVISSKTQEYTLSLQAVKQAKIFIHLAYFPAWKAQLDNQEIPLQSERDGMSLRIPAGLHRLTLSFRQTPIELAGNVISLAGIAMLILGILYARKKSV